MGVPEPKVALDDACSTIYNNTLYSYSSKAFQSLRIEPGAEWELLDSGVSVTGGQCVHATPPDNNTVEALYIVGGSSSNATYPGLQRYIFGEGIWETVTAASYVTQNRLYHGAIYLNASANILVYAGTQDGSMQDSSQTFTISTAYGHEVSSYPSSASPTLSPLLLPWTNDSAIVVGGSDNNRDVKVFRMGTSWVDTNITLADPLTKNSSMVQCILISGDDGSKSLYTFDMSVSPNEVNRTILMNAGGEPVSDAIPISRKMKERDEHSEQATRKGAKTLTVSDWPAYNSTFAPTSTRFGYSVAQSADGLVAVSGGNADDSVCLFSATDNAWLNTTAEFSVATKTQTPISTSSSITPVAATTPAKSSASAATTSAATGSKSSGKSDDLKVLAPVLGSIVGVAILLILILFFLRWRRRKRAHAEAGHQRRASGLSNDEKGHAEVQVNYSSSFLDLDQAHGFQGHKAGKESHSSFSSMAILMGRVGQSSGHRRGDLGRGNTSNASSASSLFNKKYKNAISNPIPQANGLGAMNGGLPGALVKEVSFNPEVSGSTAPAARARASNSGRRGSTRRSSGWNRYWSGGSGAMSILGIGAKRNTCSSSLSDRSSDSYYSSDQRIPSQVTQISALVPPLSQAAGGNFGLSRVASGSPRVSHAPSNFPFKESMTGQLGHSRQGSADSWEDQRTDPFSSGVPESVHEFGAAITSWDTPLPPNPRVPSSAYSASNYDRTTIGTNIGYGGVPSFNPAMGRFPTPPTSQPPAYEPWRQGHQQQNSDMSWLNLGADSTRAPYQGSHI